MVSVTRTVWICELKREPQVKQNSSQHQKKALGSVKKTMLVPVNALENTVVERVERKDLDQISLEFDSLLQITPPDSPRFTRPSPPLLQLEEQSTPSAPVDSEVTM